MEPSSGSGGTFDLPNDENADGEKKSTHLELQEKYGGDAVTVSTSTYSIFFDEIPSRYVCGKLKGPNSPFG